MKPFVVSFALLLAACATPSRESPAPAPAEPESPRAAALEASTPRVARAAPPAAAVPVEPSTPAMPSFRDFVAVNDERLLEIYVGLDRAALARVMLHGAGRWPNPYRHEALKDRQGRGYEVFYYLTRDPEGKPVKDRHLTPVIVRDDVIVAIGAYRLKKLRRGESLELPKRRASK